MWRNPLHLRFTSYGYSSTYLLILSNGLVYYIAKKKTEACTGQCGKVMNTPGHHYEIHSLSIHEDLEIDFH